MVCVDLEDAVPIEEKRQSRNIALQWFRQDSKITKILRVNDIKSVFGLEDILEVSKQKLQRGFLMLPKTSHPKELQIVDAIFKEKKTSVKLIALVETLEGIKNIDEIANATESLSFIMFGAADYAAELNCQMTAEALSYARSRILVAAKLANILSIDSPCMDIKDQHAVIEESKLAKSLGFSGKALIHPANVKITNEIFSPTKKEIDEATEILSIFNASSDGVVSINGKLIDKPVITKMQQILSLAESIGKNV